MEWLLAVNVNGAFEDLLAEFVDGRSTPYHLDQNRSLIRGTLLVRGFIVG